jgi:hypothetical protein
VLRIRDGYPGSRILIFTHPGSRFSDPGSRISDPGSRIPDLGSRIPDLGSRIQKQQQKRGVKKICCHAFLCSHKFHQIENYFSFDMLKKKIRAKFQRIVELFSQKIVTKLLKIWVWDLGSEIPDPDPGSRGQKGTGSRIRNTFSNYQKRNRSMGLRYRYPPDNTCGVLD